MTRITIEQKIDASDEVMKSTVETNKVCPTLDELLPLIEQALRGMGYSVDLENYYCGDVQ